MANTEQTLPEQIIEATQALTQTLEMENTVIRNQIEGLVKINMDMYQQLITYCKEELAFADGNINPPAQQYLDDLEKMMVAALQQSPKLTTATVSPPDIPEKNETVKDLDTALIQAVGESYRNAVATQQQINALHIACVTQGMMQIYSVGTVTLSIAIAHRLGQG